MNEVEATIRTGGFVKAHVIALLDENARLREAILHARAACRDNDHSSADNILTRVLVRKPPLTGE